MMQTAEAVLAQAAALPWTREQKLILAADALMLVPYETRCLVVRELANPEADLDTIAVQKTIFEPIRDALLKADMQVEENLGAMMRALELTREELVASCYYPGREAMRAWRGAEYFNRLATSWF